MMKIATVAEKKLAFQKFAKDDESKTDSEW
jgi:hypothetical protein